MFRINSCVRQGLRIDGTMKEVKLGLGRTGVRSSEEDRGLRLFGMLDVDNLVLCDESEEDLTVII